MGFDKFRKFLYGYKYIDGTLEIFAQSVFGGSSNLLYHLKLEDDNVASSLLRKRDIGIITSRFFRENGDHLNFFLFSIENKTFEKYGLQRDAGMFRFITDITLLYSSSFGGGEWMLTATHESSNYSQNLYHLELNESAKTFSLVQVTNFPYNDCIHVVAHENEISIISPKSESLLVYGLEENNLLIDKQLMAKDASEQEFISSTHQRRTVKCCGFMSEDGNIRLIVLNTEWNSRSTQCSCHLYKLVNNCWENFYTLNNLFVGQGVIQALCSDDMLLVSIDEIPYAYVVNTKVLSLRDLSFAKIFHQLINAGMSVKDIKDFMNLPTFLIQKYFTYI